MVWTFRASARENRGQKEQGESKNLPDGSANTVKTVETVKKLRDPDSTPLKRGVNEREPSFSSALCQQEARHEKGIENRKSRVKNPHQATPTTEAVQRAMHYH